LSTKSPNLMVSGNKNKSSELEAKPGWSYNEHIHNINWLIFLPCWGIERSPARFPMSTFTSVNAGNLTIRPSWNSKPSSQLQWHQAQLCSVTQKYRPSWTWGLSPSVAADRRYQSRLSSGPSVNGTVGQRFSPRSTGWNSGDHPSSPRSLLWYHVF
jgi:hypothetical protein